MIDTVVLDVNETLFSLAPIEARFDEVGLGVDAVPLWFARVLRDGFAAVASGAFVTFPDLGAHHLRMLDPTVDADHVLAAFDEVTPHPDVAGGLSTLAGAGITVATFTNGTAAITHSFLERAGLDQLVAHVLDVSGPGRWKPDPVAYRWALGQIGATPTSSALVAVHPWDVAGAMRTDLTGVWLDRDDALWPPYFPSPDVRITTLEDVAAALR